MKMTFRLTVIGGLIVFFSVVTAAVFIPGLVWNPPQTIDAHPYTDEQTRGREIFYSNGCNYCHTQYVRAEDTGMGEVSDGGNYVFDNPMILGSERTGPDLSYIGRKRSEAWEIDHWKDPRQMSPLSIMPSFEFLSDDELQAMAAYLFNLGDRVAAEFMIRPPAPYVDVASTNEIPAVQPASGDQPQGWSSWQDAGLQEGKELYVVRCMTCHGCAGNGLGTYAGTLVVTPADYKQDPFRNMPPDQWFWHVSEGVQGSVMPPWKESMTEDERWKVIDYVRQIFARPVERDPDEGDPPGDYANLNNPVEMTVQVLDEGKAIFIRECRVCHGDAGTGHGPYR
ncbi:MAG: cbb3-type cytochrome c oxidase subunit II, partial [Candidatus Promineifilaceae bacterium]